MFVSYRTLTPEANAAPILWRAVRALAGSGMSNLSAGKFLGPTDRSSAVLYNMSKKLAQILSLPLVLHNTSSPRLRGLKQNDPKVHKSDNVPPEVALISTAIVVIRLVYGLDGRSRYVRDDEPILCLVLPSPEFPVNRVTQPTPSRS